MPAGSSFRIALRAPERMTDIEVGQFLLDRYIFVHLSPQKNKQKFDMLAYVTFSPLWPPQFIVIGRRSYLQSIDCFPLAARANND